MMSLMKMLGKRFACPVGAAPLPPGLNSSLGVTWASLGHIRTVKTTVPSPPTSHPHLGFPRGSTRGCFRVRGDVTKASMSAWDDDELIAWSRSAGLHPPWGQWATTQPWTRRSSSRMSLRSSTTITRFHANAPAPSASSCGASRNTARRILARWSSFLSAIRSAGDRTTTSFFAMYGAKPKSWSASQARADSGACEAIPTLAPKTVWALRRSKDNRTGQWGGGRVGVGCPQVNEWGEPIS